MCVVSSPRFGEAMLLKKKDCPNDTAGTTTLNRLHCGPLLVLAFRKRPGAKGGTFRLRTSLPAVPVVDFWEGGRTGMAWSCVIRPFGLWDAVGDASAAGAIPL